MIDINVILWSDTQRRSIADRRRRGRADDYSSVWTFSSQSRVPPVIPLTLGASLTWTQMLLWLQNCFSSPDWCKRTWYWMRSAESCDISHVTEGRVSWATLGSGALAPPTNFNQRPGERDGDARPLSDISDSDQRTTEIFMEWVWGPSAVDEYITAEASAPMMPHSIKTTLIGSFLKIGTTKNVHFWFVISRQPL